MWQQWRNYLEDNQQRIKEQYYEHMLPTLAGAIMYFAKERKSYSEKPQLDFAERKNMGDVRMISIFRHNDFYDYVYVEEPVAKETPIAVFFALFQFDFTPSYFPTELPSTWRDYLTQWLEEKFNFCWLHETLAKLWEEKASEPLLDYLSNATKINPTNHYHSALNSASPNVASILEALYRGEEDHSATYLLIDRLHQELLEKISSYSLLELYQNYEWYFWRFRAEIGKDRSTLSNNLLVGEQFE